MRIDLYLFCGGRAIDDELRPKPLMKIGGSRTLLAHFLRHVHRHRPTMPASIKLLCDDGQELALEAELRSLDYAVPVSVRPCGPQASTFEKFRYALQCDHVSAQLVQFGYPDIFFFGDYVEPTPAALESGQRVHISAASIASRFPRLIVDTYKGQVRGISDYSSPVPANPLHVFGGDLWGRADQLLGLSTQFVSQACLQKPTLEHDFFFWLINHSLVDCVMQYGDRVWVDSPRDVEQLLSRTKSLL